MFDKELKKKLKEYKLQLIEEQKKKDFLINHETNWEYLEELIQQVNDNPLLKVTVTLSNGTKLELQTYKQPKKLDSIEKFDIE